MSIRVGRNGSASIQLTINDGLGVVTNVKLVSKQIPVVVQFYDSGGSVIFSAQLSAPLNQAINLQPAERPVLVSDPDHGTLSIPYLFRKA